MERDEGRQDFEGRRGLLWLGLESGWSVQEFSNFLQSLRYAHASITLAFQELPATHTRFFPQRLVYSAWESRVLFGSSEYERGSYNRLYNELYSQYYEYHRATTLNRLWPGDDILLREMSLQSPGFAEIIGMLNPLTAINDFIRMIRDWKPEKERVLLENELLRAEIMQKHVQTMKEAGYTDAMTREYVNNHIVEPLNEIRPYQDRGLVREATIKGLGPPPPEPLTVD